MTRDDIVNEAASWLGTLYRHQASLKGVGCDCLGLVRGLWRAFYGEEPEALPGYSPDWAEATGEEAMLGAAGRHLVPIAPDLARAGDVILFRWRDGLPAKHAGVLIAADRFIHAHEGASVSTATLCPWWRRRIAAAFTWPGIAD